MVCEVRKGVRGCYRRQGRCMISPAGNLTSFDGMFGPMGVLGAFELVSLCNQSAEFWFRVVVDIRICSHGALTVETVYIFFKKVTITVNSQRIVWVRKLNIHLTYNNCKQIQSKRYSNDNNENVYILK